VPHLTIIIGSSYGAGTYGMSGRAYGNRFTFLWPTAKIAVMGPKQIAGVMSMVRRNQATRQGVPFDEEEDARIVAAVEEVQEKGSLALAATGAISDDGIIDPRDTRTVLGLCLSVVKNRAVEGAKGYGVFRL
jgi:acetyl-CoA carboxylase carboxyltransferase component